MNLQGESFFYYYFLWRDVNIWHHVMWANTNTNRLQWSGGRKSLVRFSSSKFIILKIIQLAEYFCASARVCIPKESAVPLCVALRQPDRGPRVLGHGTLPPIPLLFQMYGLSCRLSLWWQLVASSVAPRLVLSQARARELSAFGVSGWVSQGRVRCCAGERTRRTLYETSLSLSSMRDIGGVAPPISFRNAEAKDRSIQSPSCL